MTLHTPVTAVPINARKFVLATDLDGTFLGGSEAERKTLYDWIEANRDTIGLIFVTGRDPKFIGELCGSGVPWPEYVIGDVGTTIARVHNRVIEPIVPLEEDIASRWGNAGDAVRAALHGHPGLTLQPTEFRYRVSYNLHPGSFDAAAHEIVEKLGHDTLVSDNKYFDVLPRGVSKGPSLQRLVTHLEIPPELVLAAGDTMNDLSMLQCGLPAVAVGGSEPDLLSRVKDLTQVHKATAIGAAGILEAVAVRNLHPTPKGD
ncbi:HAD-IIB family hydrolase [Puniceibacterium sediminis]|uniref:HAD-superfamily hydrolase, subfamily IIB n=1 Tax=Puniceibacterium sediminis TaxID=1608407 RepID=A0A238X3V2_9RHOB|nr:HAD-IIB family hydrolase [Puniceibacterium sediminis]SNR52529.1 HAD-superfamily hydrolase, subfamily IIB [Puniceibacterium sediminis]